jgi:hypothetical protein
VTPLQHWHQAESAALPGAARKALNYRPDAASAGAEVFSRHSGVFDDFADMYAPRRRFFALDKP